ALQRVLGPTARRQRRRGRGREGPSGPDRADGAGTRLARDREGDGPRLEPTPPRGRSQRRVDAGRGRPVGGAVDEQDGPRSRRRVLAERERVTPWRARFG